MHVEAGAALTPSPDAGSRPAGVAGAPRVILRGEGLALFALASGGFALTGLSWWLYIALFLAPDLGILAYGAGPRAGAMLYNALHTTVLPALLAAWGAAAENTLVLGLAAVWAAHIGFDRMLGYGLKYDSGFHDTHLGRIGRADRAA